MGDNSVLLGVKIVTWMKLPLMLLLAVAMVQPPRTLRTNAELLTEVSSGQVLLASNRTEQKQSDMNEADIKSLQRRLDLLEALRIDASISAMKATIDYDHSLLMTIAGACLLMLVGNVLGYFKQRRTTP